SDLIFFFLRTGFGTNTTVVPERLTDSLAAPEVAVGKLASPLKVAVTACGPAARADVVNTASPELFNGTVPNASPPLKNVTVPPGVTFEVTRATSVTGSP